MTTTPGAQDGADNYPIAFDEPVILSAEERSRRLLSFWLMGILSVVVIFIGSYLMLRGANDAAQVVTVLLTPVIGLVGSVIGFYFGGNKQ
jgi:hypothetical protein